MDRTLNKTDGSPAGAGEPSEDGQKNNGATRSGWSLTEAAFIDEVDEQEGRYRVTYDSGQVTPSFAVITVVSNITGRDPSELNPLGESIDSEALDALFSTNISSGSQLTFQYCGYEIAVGTDDVVEVVTE